MKPVKKGMLVPILGIVSLVIIFLSGCAQKYAPYPSTGDESSERYEFVEAP